MGFDGDGYRFKSAGDAFMWGAIGISLGLLLPLVSDALGLALPREIVAGLVVGGLLCLAAGAIWAAINWFRQL